MEDLLSKITYYITNYAEETLSIVDGVKNKIIDKVPCGLQTYDIVADGENKIFVANSGSDTISVICSNNNNIRTLRIPNNGHIDVNFNISKVYVSNINSVAAYDMKKGSLFWKVDSLHSVKFIRLSNSKNKLLILDNNMIKIYNAYDGRFMGSITVGNSPSFIEINKSDTMAYVSNMMDNSISVIDMNNLTIKFTIFNVGNAPIGMKLLQSNLYIVNSLDNNVAIVNTLTNSVISSIPVGIGPERIACDGEKLLVSNTADNTISVINSLTNTVVTTIEGFNQPIGITVLNSKLGFISSQSNNLTEPYKLNDINEAVCIRTKKYSLTVL